MTELTKDELKEVLESHNGKNSFQDWIIENKLEGLEGVLNYTKDGEYTANRLSNSDLFFAPEKHEGYVSIYRGVKNDDYFTVGIFDSEEKAKERGGSIATVKVEWED